MHLQSDHLGVLFVEHSNVVVNSHICLRPTEYIVIHVLLKANQLWCTTVKCKYQLVPLIITQTRSLDHTVRTVI